MFLLRQARVPLACLPQDLASPSPVDDPRLEPSRLVDIAIEGARITSVHRGADSAPPASLLRNTVDLGGALVFPGLLDAHTHLDKAHTWDRAPNFSGEFWDALKILQRDSVHWTEADLHRRANFALRRAWAHGTVALRTHVDTGPHLGEAGHAVMQRLRDEWAGRLELQTVALCNLSDFSSADTAARTVELTLRHRATALGGFPQPGLELPTQLDRLLAVAREIGIGVDLHVDESGLPAAECLRAVAEAVLRNQFPFSVACGHACSLSVQAPDRQRNTIDLVKAAGLHIVSLPLCNLYLQGRSRTDAGLPRTPQWRGLTLLHEFMDAGVTVACASDNVRDAFHPYGDLDAAEVYAQSVRLGHLDTRLAASPAIVTTAPAKIMGLADAGRVGPGARADLVVFDARSFSELLSTPGAPRRLIHGESFRTPDFPPYSDLRA